MVAADLSETAYEGQLGYVAILLVLLDLVEMLVLPHDHILELG